MKTSSFGYLIKEGARNIGHNRLMSTASIGVLTACLLLIGSAVLLTVNVNSIVGYVEDQNEAVVFIKDDAAQEDIDAIRDKLNSMANVKGVQYVSKEDALQQQIDLMGEEGELLAGFESDNPFPNSYRLHIDDLSQIDDTLKQIQSLSGVQNISASTDLASTITNIKNAISTFGIMMVSVMTIVSLVIVANTIKVTVYGRRKQISIMKYVGATDFFIRMPFLVEGVLLGLISAILAYLMTWGGYSYLIQWFSTTPSSWLQTAYEHIVPFAQLSWRVLGGYCAAGVMIGAFGSTAYSGKFLKV